MMKIEPVKNTDTPEYAKKLAALLAAAGMLSGCSEQIANSPSAQKESQSITTEATTLQLEGEVFVNESSVTETTPEPSEELELMGDVATFSDVSAVDQYGEDFVNAFAEKQIPVQITCDAIEYEGVIVETCLVADSKNLFFSFYNDAAYTSPLREILENRTVQGKAEAFDYGYIDQVVQNDTTCTIIFLNSELLSSENISSILNTLESKGIL